MILQRSSPYTWLSDCLRPTWLLQSNIRYKFKIHLEEHARMQKLQHNFKDRLHGYRGLGKHSFFSGGIASFSLGCSLLLQLYMVTHLLKKERKGRRRKKKKENLTWQCNDVRCTWHWCIFLGCGLTSLIQHSFIQHPRYYNTFLQDQTFLVQNSLFITLSRCGWCCSTYNKA